MISYIEFTKRNFLFLLFITALTMISLSISLFLLPAPPHTNLVEQAYSFINNQTNLILPTKVFSEYAIYHNQYFIYFGPISSFLYIPFVIIFGYNFPQQLPIYILTIFIFIIVYKICRRIIQSEQNSLWLASFFMFGTIYLSLSFTMISSYNVQIIGLFFLLLAVLEFMNKSRLFLIGLFISLAGLTRITYYVPVIFFILEILKGNLDLIKKIKKVSVLLSIITFSILILGLYNFFRFGSFLESGYSYENDLDPITVASKYHGLASIDYIPSNIYMLLFKAPEPILVNNQSFALKFPYLKADPWGMGIFFTSPLFIYLILANRKEKYIRSAIITIPFLLIIPLTYYGIGRWQFGYRYALDAYPFLLLILASIFKDKLPLLAKVLIIYSMAFNLLFMYSMWNKYPFKI